MEELELERELLGAPDRPRRLEADVAVGVVVEIEQVLGHDVLGRPVRLLRELAGERAHRLETESAAEAEAAAAAAGAAADASRSQQRGRQHAERTGAQCGAQARPRWRRGVFETRERVDRRLASDLDHDCNPRPCGHAVTVPAPRLPKTLREILC